MKKILRIAAGAAAVLYAVSLIYYSEEVAEGIRQSLNICFHSIMPSLYAFMVVSGFIISSGMYRFLGRPFGAAARYIFKVPEEMFPVFLLSSAAGYPVGAKLLTDMYIQRGTDRDTAERMLSCCYMGGPAFFCGVAGTGIYGSPKIGIMLFLCVFAANIMTGIAAGIGTPVPPKEKKTESGFSISFGEIIGSISSGGAGIAKICCSIVFFSSVSSVLEASGILGAAAAALSAVSGIGTKDSLVLVRSVLEISNISGLSADRELMPAVAALLSFGGICVIIQTEGVIGGKLSTNNFYLYRILSILISYICCKLVICFIDIDKFIQASSGIYVGYRQNSPIPSVFLLIMTILLLSKIFIVKNKKI